LGGRRKCLLRRPPPLSRRFATPPLLAEYSSNRRALFLTSSSEESEIRWRQIRSERLWRRESPRVEQSTESIEKWDYALRGPNEIIYNPHADGRGIIVSRIVFATYGPGACVNWGSEIETICLLTQHSRSAPVKVKFGIKASAMLSSLTLATAFVAGCTEETPPEAAKPASSPPAAVAPSKGGDMAPAVPPATPPKTEEKK
jgi:hypothetical protein